LVRQIIDNEDGYTVVEILVALTLLTIISTIVGSVFIFTARQMNNWRESVNSINEVHIVTERLYRDALHSNQIQATDTNLVFNHPGNRSIQYSNLNHNLIRNRVRLSDQGDSLYFKEINISEEMSRFEIQHVIDNVSNTHSVVVANRQPKLWEAVSRD